MKTTRLLAIGMALITASAMSFAARQIGPKVVGAKAPAVRQQGGVDFEWWGPGPGRLNQKPVAHGQVTSVDAGKLEIQTPKNGLMQFIINAQTKVMVNGKPASIADVKKDDKVLVRFQPVDGGSPIALGVAVPKAPAVRKAGIRGKITSIVGSVIMIGEQRVTVNSDTKFRSGRYIGTLADLRVGYQVVVGGDPAAAKVIEFQPMIAKGAVTEVTVDTITIKTIRQDILQLKPSAATIFMVRPRVGDNHLGTIADVKVGLPVNAGFHADNSALLWIDILTGI
ncbi:MAG: DUF5666 domain-containing protein [Armatimonadetes bacterium]|nr:DUF5666 domain-containing protein [Armatimonadota bacterium]